MWMESTGFGASALLVSLDQTAESVSSDCVVLNYIIHAFDAVQTCKTPIMILQLTSP